ncbi:MAG: Type restriction enzyme res subunit [Mucilaginibacter sp.]|nr:Type restriction enzyme res subunit [Mucilaginibacter sp.]
MSGLDKLRIKGQQDYLETNFDHFSRIVHDYSDNKGFIIWMDLLEEKLF